MLSVPVFSLVSAKNTILNYVNCDKFATPMVFLHPSKHSPSVDDVKCYVFLTLFCVSKSLLVRRQNFFDVLCVEQGLQHTVEANSISLFKAAYIRDQRWSRGNRARGQGHKKISRPRPKTKDTDASVLQKKVFKFVFEAISKKKRS